MRIKKENVQAGKTPRLGDASPALPSTKCSYKNLMNSLSPNGETPAMSKLVRHHAQDVATPHPRHAGSNEASPWELLKLPPPAFFCVFPEKVPFSVNFPTNSVTFPVFSSINPLTSLTYTLLGEQNERIQLC